jgi:dTMP kinase
MRFIIIEGLDGSGKDTQARQIRKKYLDLGDKVILRSHPADDNFFGRKAKNALLGRGKINKLKASLYYALDVIRSVRLYHGKADTVIFVRYLLGVAYLPFPFSKLCYKFFANVLPTSNYMFFLDVEAEESLKRLSKRDKKEMFENFNDLIMVREKQLELANKWHIINACDSIENVQMKMDLILDSLDQNDN